ncbi:LysM peptidoglycan-binding domain-containing protein [Mycolicibacterium sp. J2]|uniref:LysM peptidoglycan-binding domain-containing protein n=1 Tax=Mycolicibacterium sp. J2 TaxID=2993511 RepID=UPI00224AFEEF|nr:LysM peptidoglycan-binding domain-containing protein [Mycolicibacterium sp. J2]MCX2711360.1 LysM peptidoglycan-binding domain-containing protein [Mycolicibacterium sp. J2]
MTVMDTRFGTELDDAFDSRFDSRFEAQFEPPFDDRDFGRARVALRRPAPAEVWPLPRDVVVRRRRPQVRRPAGAAFGYRGTGVLMSRASRRRRPITPVTTVVLALIAAAITVWLGLVAQVGGGVGDTAVQVPTRLSVVQVEAGETLQHVAQRVAPDAPVNSVVDRIKELNKLDSSAVLAGQTLIAPIG